MTPDPLRAAIETSTLWYDGIFALHSMPVRSDGRLWAALGPLPPWHSAVKTLVPDVEVDAVLRAMEPHPHGSVADSFGTLDLDSHGFDLLFEATWVHHPGAADASWPPAWSVVGNADLLDEWCRVHDYAGVLPAAVLAHPAFRVLARVTNGEPSAGAVIHDAGRVAGLSNLWSGGEPLTPDDVADLIACAAALHPGRPITDYARGEELEVMLAAGFEPVGTQRVWAR